MTWKRLPNSDRAERAWLRAERKRVRFLVDEDLAWISHPLRRAGWHALSVHDLGLAHRDDQDVLKAAHRTRRFILTKDRNFLKGKCISPTYAKASVIILRADSEEDLVNALGVSLRTFGHHREIFKGSRITATADGHVTINAGYEPTQRYYVPPRGANYIWEG